MNFCACTVHKINLVPKSYRKRIDTAGNCWKALNVCLTSTLKKVQNSEYREKIILILKSEKNERAQKIGSFRVYRTLIRIFQNQHFFREFGYFLKN